VKIFGVIGWKNNGKTGLMERLIAEISTRGFSVSTIKHAHHHFDIDHEGKDSFRHREAGAHEVLLAAGQRFALMHEVRGGEEPTLEHLLTRLSDVDLVLVEGYKHAHHPKIEAHRSETAQPLIARNDPHVVAVASDVAIDGLSQPVLSLDDTTAIADFILSAVGLS